MRRSSQPSRQEGRDTNIGALHGGGCVLCAGLNDGVFGCGFDFERGVNEGGCNAAAKMRGMDDQAVDVDRVGAETPGDRTYQVSLYEGAEELLAAGRSSSSVSQRGGIPSEPISLASTRYASRCSCRTACAVSRLVMSRRTSSLIGRSEFRYRVSCRRFRCDGFGRQLFAVAELRHMWRSLADGQRE